MSSAPSDRRLGADRLAELPPAVRRPGYAREALAIGHVHIGVGAFHRCHQAEFVDDMLEQRFGPWGLLGVNLVPPSLVASLAPQDGLYSRTLREGDRSETRVIGALRRVIDAIDAAGAEAAVAALAAPEIRIVTMTVTEKGYGLRPADGALDLANPDLAADLAGGFPPRSLFGLLARSLARRRAEGCGPLTLLSCDNIPANGQRLRRGLVDFVGAGDAALARWIETQVAFPCSMVDRIVPASTEADRESAARLLGCRDEAAVYGEPFRQWVIEDRFAAERPPWDLAGAEFVADAEPYEHIKMRVLNAAQSTLSHWGALCGMTYSHEAASNPTLSALTVAFLEHETAPTLPDAGAMVVQPYIGASLARIRNTAIHHRCHQIGTDGSQKIVQRLLAPLRARLAQGAPADGLIFAVAGWLAYVLAGARRFGARWAASDPWADALVGLAATNADLEALARAALSIEPVFGTDLARPEIVAATAKHLGGLLMSDPRAYLARRLADG